MFSEQMRYEYPLTADSIVLDVGLHKGTFAAEISRRYGCVVHGFEPVDSFREEALAKVSSYPKVHIHSFALGSVSVDAATISVHGDTSGFYGAPGEQTQACRIVSLVEFLRERNITRVDLLKLNVEGSEYDLVEHILRERLATRIVDLQVQWHPVVKDFQQRYDDLARRLRETHALTYREPWVWESWRLK